MLKFIIPAIIVFLIVLFWEKINEIIYKKFNIKLNYLLIIKKKKTLKYKKQIKIYADIFRNKKFFINKKYFN